MKELRMVLLNTKIGIFFLFFAKIMIYVRHLREDFKTTNHSFSSYSSILLFDFKNDIRDFKNDPNDLYDLTSTSILGNS